MGSMVVDYSAARRDRSVGARAGGDRVLVDRERRGDRVVGGHVRERVTRHGANRDAIAHTRASTHVCGCPEDDIARNDHASCKSCKVADPAAMTYDAIREHQDLIADGHPGVHRAIGQHNAASANTGMRRNAGARVHDGREPIAFDPKTFDQLRLVAE